MDGGRGRRGEDPDRDAAAAQRRGVGRGRCAGRSTQLRGHPSRRRRRGAGVRRDRRHQAGQPHRGGGPPIHGRDRPGGELPGVGARRIRVQPRAGADRHRTVPAGCLRARLRALRRGGCAGRTRRGRDHQRGSGRGHVRSGGRRRDALQLCRRRRGLRPIDQPALRDRDNRWLRLRAGGGLRPAGLSRTRRQATGRRPARRGSPLGLGTSQPRPWHERAALPRLGLDRPGLPRLPSRVATQPADPPRPRRRCRSRAQPPQEQQEQQSGQERKERRGRQG